MRRDSEGCVSLVCNLDVIHQVEVLEHWDEVCLAGQSLLQHPVVLPRHGNCTAVV